MSNKVASYIREAEKSRSIFVTPPPFWEGQRASPPKAFCY